MNFTIYIQPELLILIPVLTALGAGLKQSERIPDNIIPLALGFAGIALAVAYVLSTADLTQGALMAAFTGVTQGILCAAGAVYANQLWKQMQQ